MAQLIKGTTYATNDQVTATNLNNLVDLGQLAPGAITDQSPAASVSGSDQLLINQGGLLKRATASQVSGTLDTSTFIKSDGLVSMQAPLLLSSTSAPAALNAAVSLAYVQSLAIPGGTAALATLVQKSGDSMTGNLNMTNGSVVVLGTVGTSDLSAVNKQYVSQQFAAFSASTTPTTSLNNHLTNFNNPHQVSAAQLGLAAFASLSPSTLSISTATQAALDAKLNLSGGTLTGALALSTAAISGLYQATHKTYVDTADALKLNLSGGTITGPVNFTSSAPLTLTPATQTTDFAAITVQQLKAATVQQPRIVASGWLATGSAVSAPINTLNESTFLTVSASRVAGTTNITINYSSLGADYANVDRPFFLVNQFVGIKAATNVSAALYKIVATDINNKTFVCAPQGSAAFPTTAFTGVSVQLSCVYNNRNATDSLTSNIKSIYIDLGVGAGGSNKYYVNYIEDTTTGSQTNATPSVVKTAFACGNATTLGEDGVLLIMVDIGTNTNYQNVNSATGLGATTMGAHVGYFAFNQSGLNNNYVYAASLAIGQR